MYNKVKRTVVTVLSVIICNALVAQTNYSFFKVEDGIHYSQDKGLTWYAATTKSKITKQSTLINNPLGKRYALVNEDTDQVYWCDLNGKHSLTDIIKSVLRKDSYFSSLFSNIQSSNNSPVYARYERRGGVKMGKNKDVYIESIVAHKLKNGSGQSGAVRYIRNKSTNGTFYFEYINTTSKTLEYILVEYDKKNNYWSIPLNYTNGDKEIVLTIPANSEISLENIVFKNNHRKEYYLVAIEENMQFSWRNLLKELNNSLVRPVNGDCESALYIFTDK